MRNSISGKNKWMERDGDEEKKSRLLDFFFLAVKKVEIEAWRIEISIGCRTLARIIQAESNDVFFSCRSYIQQCTFNVRAQ